MLQPRPNAGDEHVEMQLAGPASEIANCETGDGGPRANIGAERKDANPDAISMFRARRCKGFGDVRIETEREIELE
jgi:hypothetical protein